MIHPGNSLQLGVHSKFMQKIYFSWSIIAVWCKVLAKLKSFRAETSSKDADCSAEVSKDKGLSELIREEKYVAKRGMFTLWRNLRTAEQPTCSCRFFNASVKQVNCSIHLEVLKIILLAVSTVLETIPRNRLLGSLPTKISAAPNRKKFWDSEQHESYKLCALRKSTLTDPVVPEIKSTLMTLENSKESCMIKKLPSQYVNTICSWELHPTFRKSIPELHGLKKSFQYVKIPWRRMCVWETDKLLQTLFSSFQGGTLCLVLIKTKIPN